MHMRSCDGSAARGNSAADKAATSRAGGRDVGTAGRPAAPAKQPSLLRQLSRQISSTKLSRSASAKSVAPPQPNLPQPAVQQQQQRPQAADASGSGGGGDGGAGGKSAKERMRELKELFDSGLISQVEFDSKRSEILASL